MAEQLSSIHSTLENDLKPAIHEIARLGESVKWLRLSVLGIFSVLLTQITQVFFK